MWRASSSSNGGASSSSGDRRVRGRRGGGAMRRALNGGGATRGRRGRAMCGARRGARDAAAGRGPGGDQALRDPVPQFAWYNIWGHLPFVDQIRCTAVNREWRIGIQPLLQSNREIFQEAIVLAETLLEFMRPTDRIYDAQVYSIYYPQVRNAISSLERILEDTGVGFNLGWTRYDLRNFVNDCRTKYL